MKDHETYFFGSSPFDSCIYHRAPCSLSYLHSQQSLHIHSSSFERYEYILYRTMMLQRKQFLLLLLLLAQSIQTAASWELSFGPRHDKVVEESDAGKRDLLEFNANPTSSPTESPAPSPSPSSQPTSKPTFTPKPTGTPTSSPTESPAPSPSPSSQPTANPTKGPSASPSSFPTSTPYPTPVPSGMPSESPSSAPSPTPSEAPSISLEPSSSPTDTPSTAPSMAPSASMMPSVVPSGTPTLSQQPSSMPTHIEVLEASFVVKLGLTSDLNVTQMVAFQLATADWIAMQASLSDVVVQITRQKLLTSNARRLQTAAATDTNDSTADDSVVVVTGLQIDFDTAAQYTGPNKSFDLYGVLNPSIQGLDSSWLQRVAGSNSIFESIRPSFTPVPLSQGAQNQGEVNNAAKSKNDNSGAGAAGVTMAILVAGLAVLMGIAASVYSVRKHRVAVYGEELESPKEDLNYCPSPSNSIGDVTLGSPRSNASTQYGNVELTTSGNIMTNLSDKCCATKPDVLLSPASPNTMERGKNCGADDVFQGLPFRSRADVDGGRATQDPPTNSEANFNNHHHQHAYRNKQSLFDASEQRSEISMDSRFMGSQADAFMGANNRAKYNPQYPPKQRRGSGSHSGQQMSHELMLTKSQGGTLGAADIGRSRPAESQASASDFGSQAKSFFSGMMGTEKATAPAAANNNYRSGAPSMEYSNSNVSGASGARGVGSDDRMPSYDTMPSYDAMLRRAGLYDVFAPAGPIGIVVDTTKEGPAVHSLKSTSPMLGLINPGDLIVGLDDQDTRGMTAATLTRLMAKKSSQKERKITLLATESFY
jgi:hypothetical protein